MIYQMQEGLVGQSLEKDPMILKKMEQEEEVT